MLSTMGERLVIPYGSGVPLCSLGWSFCGLVMTIELLWCWAGVLLLA